MKQTYEKADAEVILFSNSDVVTTSNNDENTTHTSGCKWNGHGFSGIYWGSNH